jgi:hypothetical protein
MNVQSTGSLISVASITSPITRGHWKLVATDMEGGVIDEKRGDFEGHLHFELHAERMQSMGRVRIRKGIRDPDVFSTR